MSVTLESGNKSIKPLRITRKTRSPNQRKSTKPTKQSADEARQTYFLYTGRTVE
jgi:hypothetical protein